MKIPSTKDLGVGCQVSGVSAALKSGQSNRKKNFVLGYFHMTG
jgi:hypothetical protein